MKNIAIRPKINYKNFITFFTTVPLVLVFVFVYFFLSAQEVKSMNSNITSRLEKMANEINLRLDNINNISNTLVTNNYILDIFAADYKSVNENINAYYLLNMCLSGYRSSPDSYSEEILIIHSNPSLYENKYCLLLGDITDEKLLSELSQLTSGGFCWTSDEKNIILLKKSSDYTNRDPIYLKYSIPYSEMESSVRSLTSTLYEDYYREITFKLESLAKGADATFYSPVLLNGDRICCFVPPELAQNIFIRNLYYLLLAIAVMVSAIIIFSNVFSNTITKRMYKFLDDFENNITIGKPYSPLINDFDELSPVYEKISYLVSRLNQMHADANRLRAEKAQMELNVLQAEINPHLLYNTLSVLKWEYMDSFPAGTEIIDALVNYYRGILHNGQLIITIRDEIALIENYIAIVSYANNKKYTCNISIDEDVLSVYTFKLILQPFVENAVLHGLFKSENPVIDIKGSFCGEDVILTVSDNGIGIEKELLERINSANYLSSYTSYGIKNTAKRINLLYGENNYIKVESRPGCGTKVIICIKSLTKEELESK